MTVYDFCMMACADDYVVSIFDMADGRQAFMGTASEARWSDYEAQEVLSWDLCADPDGKPYIELNIETDSENF